MKTKKSLGQHFLTSTDIVDDIVRASRVQAGDSVLEIGPGEGILTHALLATGARVTAVEKDDRLIPVLQKKFLKEILDKKLDIVHADILACNIEHLIPTPYHVVANIPYYITGQIIRMFLESSREPQSMTLLVQKEVAERIVAMDGKESLLSLSVKAFGVPEYVCTVDKEMFTPAPNVDSAVLYVGDINKSRLSGVPEKSFFALLHAGFAHKRKQLLPNLSTLYTKDALASAFRACDLDPKCRAENLSLETWVSLCKRLF